MQTPGTKNYRLMPSGSLVTPPAQCAYRLTGGQYFPAFVTAATTLCSPCCAACLAMSTVSLCPQRRKKLKTASLRHPVGLNVASRGSSRVCLRRLMRRHLRDCDTGSTARDPRAIGTETEGCARKVAAALFATANKQIKIPIPTVTKLHD